VRSATRFGGANGPGGDPRGFGGGRGGYDVESTATDVESAKLPK
jgi:hypothetical protein